MAAKRRRGIGALECIIALLIVFALCILVWEMLIKGSRASVRLSGKLDRMRAARMAHLKVSRELRESVEFFHPPMGAKKSSSLLVYLNRVNEIVVLFVDPEGQLIRLNRSEEGDKRVLARNVETFRVFRRGRRLVDYHLHLVASGAEARISPEGTDEFSLISGVTLRNNFN